ncbi:MAG: ATP-binding cassette domain-containing protein [Flavihumibacter sp.]
MTISLSDAGKRYNREWIFRHFTQQFEQGSAYAITGPNGSGKSTLLQCIAGAIQLSEGKLTYIDRQTPVADDKSHECISLATPYLELIEEMTAMELLHFQQTFKPFRKGPGFPEMLTRVRLSNAAHKQIRYYSSGMKQRMKLLLAFFADTPVLLLDEPSTNLDAEGVDAYKALLQSETGGRLLIISSNDPNEYEGCQEVISIYDFKPALR